MGGLNLIASEHFRVSHAAEHELGDGVEHRSRQTRDRIRGWTIISKNKYLRTRWTLRRDAIVRPRGGYIQIIWICYKYLCVCPTCARP